MTTPSIPPPSPSTSSPVTSAYPKLDGVLYHFYTKTVALICSERLGNQTEPAGTAEAVSTPAGSGSASATDRPSAASGAPPRRTSRWFSIETPEQTLFKEELRLWRQPSTLIPTSILDDLPLERSTLPAYVPELILDVILDLNLVPENSFLRQSGADAVLVKRPGDVKAVVLERWRLSFDVHTVPAPPELSTIYNTCVGHFQEMDAKLRSLPAYGLTAKLRGGVDSPLRLGLRLSAGEVEEAPSVLGPTAALSDWPHRPGSVTFAPVTTGIGSLSLRVETRAGFDVEVVELDSEAKGLDLADFDEGYFRPVAPQGQPSVAPQKLSTPSPATRSLLSRAADQKAAARSGAQPSANTSPASPSPPTIPAASVESALSRSPAPQTSAFGTSASNKPVAGLSSLRGASALSTSPANTRAPLSSEAAFLTHQRRQSSSASDRRLRTLSSYSSEKSSPPSPTSAASPQTLSRPGFATRASAFPSFRMGSYSPSSSSPLAQHMTAQQRGQQPSSIDSGSLDQTQMNPGASPTLRSVFHGYTSSQGPAYTFSPFSRSLGRSAGESALGLARTDEAPPRTALTSYDERAPSTSPALSSTAARPQMIQRYSSTLSYRQGRPRRSSASLTGGEPGAAQTRPGTSEDSNYSRSWQARIDQRQAYAAAYHQPSSNDPRSLGTAESESKIGSFAMGAASPRPSPRYRSSISASHEDDLDDLVRMIENRNAMRTEPTQSSTTAKPPSGALAMSPIGRASPALGSGSLSRRRGSFRAGGNSSPLSRSQINEMLNRMAASFGRPSPASAATTGSGGSASEGSPSQAIGTSAEGSPSITRSPLSAPPMSASSKPIRPFYDGANTSQARTSSEAFITATAPIFARPRPAGAFSARPVPSYDADLAMVPSGAALNREGSRSSRGRRGGGGGGSGSEEEAETGRLIRTPPSPPLVDPIEDSSLVVLHPDLRLLALVVTKITMNRSDRIRSSHCNRPI
ncbi:Phosphoprotein involved in cytoplasm to vacuole targeting and autophagy [Ceraceosorus bombacis]|uniref:Autophagy-related protein 13 n=1 Tax=Ceraceosorus bombacis TaxID=401625 RepID=A0A0P1BR22_9BASI|nr:Phosphoprotein involved in cytoplasm to vacuole targeting and autophagy [Ceraceosorus bombacis]